MEPIEVTARFDISGEIHPLSFVWQGRKYPLASSGRRWQDKDGLHILVMAPPERVFELIYMSQEGRWFIKPLTNPGRVV